MWIARDKNGRLFAYKKRPMKGEFCFLPKYGTKMCEVCCNYYDWMTWDNSPYYIRISYEYFFVNYGIAFP